MTEPSEADSAAVKAAASGVRAFLKKHGANGATAVVEHLGRSGVRIVLVGADGRWGDLVVPSAEIARLAVERAGVETADGWERELTARVVSTAYEWTRMGRATS